MSGVRVLGRTTQRRVHLTSDGKRQKMGCQRPPFQPLGNLSLRVSCDPNRL